MDGECQLQNDIKNNNVIARSETTKQSHSAITNHKITLGQVDFINCLPVNLPIKLGEVSLDADIISAVPSELNRMILNNEIDIAPVSSIAYLGNKDKLDLFGNLCIASNGQADSVLLFSKFPIEELDGADILLSKASATSNKLIQVIFKEFLEFDISYNKSDKPSARLLIGDDALLEYSKKARDIFIYDLGSLWKKYTGLPMVFGLWVIRKDIAIKYPEETDLLSKKLNEAKEIGLSTSIDKVIKKAQEKVLISREFYSNYFKHLSYNFNSECKEGLELFESYCRKDALTKV